MKENIFKNKMVTMRKKILKMNYYLDGSVGKDAHVSRLSISNHLAKLNIHGWLEFVEAFSLVQIDNRLICEKI